MLTVRSLLALLALTAIVATAGCSNATEGDAAKKPATADTSELHPANYPTTPRPPLGNAGTEGQYVEARRMADFIVMPFDVDPALTAGGGIAFFNGPFKGADAIGTFFDTFFPDTAARNYVTGFMTSRQHEGGRNPNLFAGVLRYQAAEDAAAAADVLGVKGGPDPARYPEYKAPDAAPTSIPGHPESRGLTWSGTGTTVTAYTPHGPYLLVHQSYSTVGPDEAMDLVTRAIDKQIPMIDQFKPTPVDKLAELPLDPDGLLARTLEPRPDERRRLKFGLYDVHAFRAFSDDPLGDEKLLNDAGVDQIAISGADVYRARDADAAATVLDAWAKTREEGGEWGTAMDPVEGLPDSHCFKMENKPGSDAAYTYYSCLFTADRYVVDLIANQKSALSQRAAAQYLLLTAE